MAPILALIGLSALLLTSCAGTRGGHDRVARRADLIGTWELVEPHLPKLLGVKIVTPTSFVWTASDSTTHEIITAVAGECAFGPGGVYIEKPQLVTGNMGSELPGSTLTFSARLEGGLCYHDGVLPNGAKVNEVWRRR